MQANEHKLQDVSMDLWKVKKQKMREDEQKDSVEENIGGSSTAFKEVVQADVYQKIKNALDELGVEKDKVELAKNVLKLELEGTLTEEYQPIALSVAMESLHQQISNTKDCYIVDDDLPVSNYTGNTGTQDEFPLQQALCKGGLLVQIVNEERVQSLDEKSIENTEDQDEMLLADTRLNKNNKLSDDRSRETCSQTRTYVREDLLKHLLTELEKDLNLHAAKNANEKKMAFDDNDLRFTC